MVAVPEGEFKTPSISLVIFGAGSMRRVAEKVDEAGTRRALIVTVAPLAEETDLVEKLKGVLGSRCAGVFSGVLQHVPRQCVLDGVDAAREAGADILISLGGSSAVDAAKAINLMLTETEKMDSFFAHLDDPAAAKPSFDNPKLPIIAIPTTLSAGEFSSVAGITDLQRKRKIGFTDIKITPSVIVLDPEATVYTGQELWASTGLKVFSDCFEEFCSPYRQPFVDALLLHAVRIIERHIISSIAEPLDLGCRAMLQHAAWMSMFGKDATSLGIVASLRHQIGGGYNVPHGVASSIIFPYAVAFNRPVIDERLAAMAGAMNLPGESVSAAASAAINRVSELIEQAGLPKRLRDVGVPKDGLPIIAGAAMKDHHIVNNPKKIESEKDLLGILEQAW
jgi:alcohol dehydrogenase class IV